MKLKILMIPFLLIVSIILVAFFQNCGKMIPISNASFSSYWFDYPYTQKPDVYAEFYFYREKGIPAAGLYDYTFLGAVAPTNGDGSTVSYVITFRDQSNKIICPTITGNSTSIHSSCTGVVKANKVIVKMSLTHNGKTEIFQKIF